MANQFDSSSASATEPTTIVAGDFVQWWQKDLASDYPTDLYTLKYTARTVSGGGDDIEIVASASDGYYLIQAGSDTTKDWLSGDYTWQKEIIRISDSARIVLSRGEFKVIGDLDVEGEFRSHSQIMLAKIESLLQGKADADVASYSIAGRSLTKLSMSELMSARGYYKNEVRKEQALAGIKGASSTIKVRFT